MSLPESQQHKNLSKILRQIYEKLLSNESPKNLFSYYNEILSWMKLPPLCKKQNLKKISDRYHWHLSIAKTYLKEHRLLPKVEIGDKKNTHPPFPISIYLDNLRSAHNVGSILRTTEALAMGSVYFSKHTPYIDNKKVQKTSMGTWKWLSCFREIPLSRLPKPIIVLETSSQSFNIHKFLFPETFTLVIGNEEYGCSDESLSKADYLLRIPLRGKKNSINVANAFAIAAGTIQRQLIAHQNKR